MARLRVCLYTSSLLALRIVRVIHYRPNHRRRIETLGTNACFPTCYARMHTLMSISLSCDRLMEAYHSENHLMAICLLNPLLLDCASSETPFIDLTERRKLRISLGLSSRRTNKLDVGCLRELRYLDIGFNRPALCL